MTVHPHVRGEYLGLGHGLSPVPGSSPRAWGILEPKTAQAKDTRFIPTCVGNTASAHALRAGRAVHPHVRGEYLPCGVSISGQHGSSPRAWGIHVVLETGVTIARFIPTCVGNTFFSSAGCLLLAVHPHVRGEYYSRDCYCAPLCGSSPRAWGIHPPKRQHPRHFRFIPTCVGNTEYADFLTAPTAVHPHVRGEYWPARHYAGYYAGSSPRAWGILMRYALGTMGGRFIPTCVGNT